MARKWIQGRCAVCNKTNGFLQRATYWDAPEEGVTVHQDCLGKFYQQLMDEQWRRDMDDEYERASSDEYEDRRVGDNRGITIIDVFKRLKIEPVPAITWAVGNAVRELYKSRNSGALPSKDLRQKTNAGGTHCFAVYPESYFPDIEKIIRNYKIEEQRQGVLF